MGEGDRDGKLLLPDPEDIDTYIASFNLCNTCWEHRYTMRNTNEDRNQPWWVSDSGFYSVRYVVRNVKEKVSYAVFIIFICKIIKILDSF